MFSPTIKMCTKLWQHKFSSYFTNCKRTMSDTNFISLTNVNSNLIKMRQPISATLATRLQELEKELFKNGCEKPFNKIIRMDANDPQMLGQPPLTFIRQIMSMVMYPSLITISNFPIDAKERANTILKGCSGGSIGSYTEASGIVNIRKDVAKFIESRDGFPCNWEDITLSGGASDGIKKLLKLFVNVKDGKGAGVMIPVPKYPLYSAALEEFGLHEIGYHLDESENWKVNVKLMQESIDEVRKMCEPRVLIIINPGNPTGHVLAREDIEEIIRWAYKENLYLISDETYQGNDYQENTEFCSFKKVLVQMGAPYTNMELASFMSCSKGHIGEGGLRAGFSEILNMCPKVKAMFNKANTAMLCPPSTGQACISAALCPPEPGEPSFKQYVEEKKQITDSLKEKARLIVQKLNSLEGITCKEIQGGVYAFPNIRFSTKAIEAANRDNVPPDAFYASELLNTTGIYAVPGHDFGQDANSYHICLSILLPIDELKNALEKFESFHEDFVIRYR